MKMSGIGGQAVLEGIMMKNQDDYAVAVRKPNQEIEVCVKSYKSITKGRKLLSLPFIRGVFNFIDSMIIGMSTLTFSASFYEDEEDAMEKENMSEDEKQKAEQKKKKIDDIVMGITIFFSIVLSLGLFIVLPSIVSDVLKKYCHITSYAAVSIIEGVLRLLIFLIYIVLISRMKDIQRTFMYHGAEHKCINCIEHGMELNVENVLKSSRLHKRCGTSFLFLVMAISIVIFIMIPIRQPVLKVVVRLLLVPVIAGISYEVLRLAGRKDNLAIRIVSAPGMALQKLTTSEPDAEMAEVAIRAVEAVFDWKAFLADYEHADKKDPDNYRPKERAQEVVVAKSVTISDGNKS